MRCANRCNREAVPGKTKCEACLESARRYAKKRYAEDPEFRARIKAQRDAWSEENKERTREIARASRKRTHLRAKKEAIERYGGKCACCGEEDYRFLTLDHAEGNGFQHREELMGNGRHGGSGFTFKLKSLGWPSVPGMRILCANCHMATDLWGGCPHQEKAILEDRTGDPEVEALR